MAKAANKPFHVVAESYKFVRLYPLNQQDVPNKWKVSGKDCFTHSMIGSDCEQLELNVINPLMPVLLGFFIFCSLFSACFTGR